jgi:hypothetical protein
MAKVSLGRMNFTGLFQFNLLSIFMLNNFIIGTSFITKFPKEMGLAVCFGTKLIIFVLLIYKTNLLDVNDPLCGLVVRVSGC